MKLHPGLIGFLLLNAVVCSSCAHTGSDTDTSVTISLEDLFGTEKEQEEFDRKFEELVKNDPHYQAVKRGDLFMKEKKFGAAIQEYELAIQAKPDDEIAYAKKGIALYSNGNPESALLALDQSLKLNKSNKTPKYWNWWPLYHKGNALGMLKRYDEAIVVYTQSLKLHPSPECYYFRGFVFHMTEKYKSSLSDYDAAIKLNPANAAFWNGKAGAHFVLDIKEPGKNHGSQACQAARSACELGDCRLVDEFTHCRNP